MLISIQEFVEELGLEVMTTGGNKTMNLTVMDTNRPGMQFCGIYEYFAADRVQIIGKMEMSYLESLSNEKQREVLDRFMKYPIPCLIVCWGMSIPSSLISKADEYHVPVFRSKYKTTRLTFQTIMYLNRILAPTITRHAVLMDVYGVGVLITGESGIGKSEAALELIKRGHQLCSDDVVEIRRVADDTLIGKSPEMTQHFMEIRGIGMINIRAMFGIGSVVVDKSIDMEIHLEKWDSSKIYERWESNEKVDILGVSLPYRVLPVKPGRNLAIVIEVAARNLSLQKLGYNAAQELDNRLTQMIQKANQQEE